MQLQGTLIFVEWQLFWGKMSFFWEAPLLQKLVRLLKLFPIYCVESYGFCLAAINEEGVRVCSIAFC